MSYSDSSSEDGEWFPLPTLHNQDVFIVYGSNTCPYCIKAVDLLDETESLYMFYDLNAFDDTSVLEEIVPTNHTTIPIVFKGQRFIGGYTELKRLLG